MAQRQRAGLAERDTAALAADPAAGGFHPLLDRDQPYIFIDACMQSWPDADYASAHRHGVTVYGVTAMDPHATVERALEEVMFWRLIARRYEHLIVADSVASIRRARQEGKSGFLLCAQGGDFIANKLHRVEAFQRLGLRVMLPAYNTSNMICSGLLDRTDAGLTRFGELVVDECNRVGVVLDGTHVGKRSVLEMIERSSQPCVFTHSNCSSIVPNPRNIDDEQIRACAARGGVIGLAPWGPLVMKPGWAPSGHHWPTVDDFIDHIDHVCELTGSSAHVGLGTDMSLGTYPDHWHDPWGEPEAPDIGRAYATHVMADVRHSMRSLDGFSSYPEITTMIERLLARGYSEADVAGFLGENFLRVFEEVWGG
jgi:membrane dipeptidase